MTNKIDFGSIYDGTFQKYVVLEVGEDIVLVSRPYGRHRNIVEEYSRSNHLPKDNVHVKGGGMLEFDFSEKEITYFGRSKEYGESNRALVQGILTQHFPNYHVSIDDKATREFEAVRNRWRKESQLIKELSE